MDTHFNCHGNKNWLPLSREALLTEGFAVVEDVLNRQQLSEIRTAMGSTAEKIRADIGEQRLRDASELSYLRLMMHYDPLFIKLLEIPQLVAIVDAHLPAGATMRYQVGVIMPPKSRQSSEHCIRQDYHVNFGHIKHVPGLAMDCLLAISDITATNGAVEVLPGSHYVTEEPRLENLLPETVTITASAGSMVLVDGALWHRELNNESEGELAYITHQFSYPIVKPQFDYCTVLGEARMQALPERTKRFLGWEARVPTNLQEFYRPAADRLYKA